MVTDIMVDIDMKKNTTVNVVVFRDFACVLRRGNSTADTLNLEKSDPSARPAISLLILVYHNPPTRA